MRLLLRREVTFESHGSRQIHLEGVLQYPCLLSVREWFLDTDYISGGDLLDSEVTLL